MNHHVYCPALASLFLLVVLGVKLTKAGAGKIIISLLQVIRDVEQKTIKAFIVDFMHVLISVYWLFKTRDSFVKQTLRL